MAEASSSSLPDKVKTLKIIGPSPERNSPKSKGKQTSTSNDFIFQLNPSTTFRHAIAALKNDTFNPTNMGLMEVDESGLSITVCTVSQAEPDCEAETVFGFFRLQAEYFKFFECTVPVTKMINLEHVLLSLSLGQDDCLLTVFSEHGLNHVTFEFEDTGRRKDPARPSVVDLLEVHPEYQRLPDINYWLHASIQSSSLIPLISSFMKRVPEERPDFMTITIHPASVILKVGENIVGERPEPEELWLNWRFWGTLERAVRTAEECRVYNVIEPAENIMLLFNLSNSYEETVTFRRGTFDSFQRTSCLANFHSCT